MFIALLTGLALGVVTSVPPGPVAALAVRAALQGRRRAVVALALGSALVEGTYAVLAGVGVSAVLVRVPALVHILYGVGGCVLVAFGAHCLRGAAQARRRDETAPQGTAPALAAGIVMTITNPVPLVSWIGVAGTFFSRFDRIELTTAAVGVVAGVLAWIAGVGLVSGRAGVSLGTAMGLSRAVGVLLVVGGAYFLVRAAA